MERNVKDPLRPEERPADTATIHPEAGDCRERELLKEAITYFRADSGFTRLFGGLLDKYRSLGRLGGVVVLADPSDAERSALEAFLRRRLPGGPISIATRQFAEALAATKFGALDPLDVLQAWHGGAVISRKECRQRREEQREALLQQLMAEFTHPFCQLWLMAVAAKDSGRQRVLQAMEHDPQFLANIRIALKALSQLPDEYQRLPVFAAALCGNPHGLDVETPAGRLFLDALRCVRTNSGEIANATGSDSASPLSAAEETSELLYHFKLLRDDLLNFATCYGLAAYSHDTAIEYWRAAAQAGAPLNIPLREIVRATAVFPRDGQQAQGQRYNVYVVENSGVFSALLDCVNPGSAGRGQCSSEAGHSAVITPLVCLHGQFKLASWALLDRLVRSGAVLYYSGDFDPEGLQMAQKLLYRYPGKARLWRMTGEDYLTAVPSVRLDDIRLNKLKSIAHPALAPLAAQIAAEGRAAYQEGLIHLLAEDVWAGGPVSWERQPGGGEPDG